MSNMNTQKPCMTIEEAIKRIDVHMRIHKLYERQAIKITRALCMAIDALKKQAPMNIVSDGNDENDWVRCPNCSEVLGTNEAAYNSFQENGLEPIYCHKCGQAIVWKEGNP